jgi:hypothetical protein
VANLLYLVSSFFVYGIHHKTRIFMTFIVLFDYFVAKIASIFYSKVLILNKKHILIIKSRSANGLLARL